MLASGPVELGFESTWGRVLASLFSLCLFFAYTKIHTFFFRFIDLVICGFIVWCGYVRTAAAVVIMYRFTAVPHVLYSSTINKVLIKYCLQQYRTPDERVRALSCLFLCSFFCLFFHFLGE